MTVATSTAAAASTAAATGSGAKLAANMDSFLKLLTAQLEHQDPLSPMDATQFTSQLVQFSTVEQAVQTNTQLSQLTKLIQGNSLTSALGFIGLDVAYAPNQVQLGANGTASLDYDLPQAADSVSVTIRDANGAVVRQASAPATAGRHAFVWDGLDKNGGRAPAGAYKVELRAIDAAGKPLTVNAEATGKVDGVETGSDGVSLTINGLSVPLSSVRTVNRPATA